MTYKQLLLANGGGVISNSQRDDQNECATIAIGLGGTGVSCLRTLKQQVYSRLKADNPILPFPPILTSSSLLSIQMQSLLIQAAHLLLSIL